MSKQKTANASRSVWWLHVLLTVIVCTWLYVAQLLNLPPIAVIGTVGGIIIFSGTIMAIRIDKVQQVWRRENRRLKQTCASGSAFTAQFVEALPALHVMFVMLQKKYATGPMAMHYFAEWLTWALKPTRSNLAEWIRTSNTSQTRQVELFGLVGHIHPAQQDSAEQHIQRYAKDALATTTLRRLANQKRVPASTGAKQPDQPRASAPAAV